MDNFASIVIVTYNHKKYLKDCLDSVISQEYPHEIIVVDNASEDGTAAFVAAEYPSVKIIRNRNTGYGAGNNLGVTQSSGEYLVFLNPDTVAEQNWLRELVAPLREKSSTITTPKILLYDGSAINTCGNINHFTGLTFTRGLSEPPQSRNRQEDVSGISGACFAIRKEDFARMVGFDERFFLYNEDSEFSWRAHLFDIRVLYVPSSAVRHDYVLNVSPQKMYHLEKGRYLILKTYFSYSMYAILAPSLVLAEIMTLGYAMRLGWTGLRWKVRAFYEGMILTRSSRHLGGRKVMGHLETQIPADQLVSGSVERFGVGICNKIFSWNYAFFLAISR